MVVLNDWGLTLEIIGFAIFMFVPLQETWNLKLAQAKENRITIFINKHDRFRYGLRYGGIGLIILGLIMQYQGLQG